MWYQKGSMGSNQDDRINWQPVLKSIYHGGYVEKVSNEQKWEYEIYSPLEVGELSRQEIEFALRYLEQHGLIAPGGRNTSTTTDMPLTETGLQIAHDMSVKERQNSINRSIMLAASVTAISSLLSAYPPDGSFLPFSLPSQVEPAVPWLTVLLITAGMLVGGYLLWVLLRELWYLRTTSPRF
jgi:predicted transcriptional regulator